MNNISEVIANIKVEYKKIYHINPTQQRLSTFLNLAGNTLTIYKRKSQIPYKAILAMCHRYNIDFKDIFYRAAKVICKDCTIELTDKNSVWYTAKKTDDNGNGIRMKRRQCESCYNHEKKIKNAARRKTPKPANCRYCNKPFTEVERLNIDYVNHKGTHVSRPSNRCVTCDNDKEMLREDTNNRKKISYRKKKNEQGIILRGEEGYVNPLKKTIKKPRKKKNTNQKPKVIKAITKDSVAKKPVEVQTQINTPIVVPSISKARQALLDIEQEHKNRQERTEELALEQKLINEYLGV